MTQQKLTRRVKIATVLGGKVTDAQAARSFA